MKSTALAAVVTGCMLVVACGQLPIRPSQTHIRGDEPRAEGAIPPPVQTTPILPKPQPAARPETYSVVVNRVAAQELLFALARDAKLQIDIDPALTGSVTLNAIDQTLPQLLARIARQIDMRYELDGQTLVIQRDTPYLHVYRIDYVNLARDVRSVASLSTQITNTGASGGGGSSAPGSNNSVSTITAISANKFWDTLVANVKDILRETDKVLPAGSTQAATPSTTAPAASATPPQAAGAPAPAAGATPPVPLAPATEYREASSVIANAESGTLAIRATSRQHEKIQEFLDQVMASAKRQVLIEATVAEVQLNNQYQRGIDWSRLRTGGAGFQFQQSSAATPAGVNTNAFIVGYATPGVNFLGALKLLESFGDVKVLSSPKISVLNNQTAMLKVVDNLVYFTIQASTTTAANTAAVTTFTTTVNSVPVGFIMSVVPQVSDSDTVVLSVRPTISRKLTDVPDPNPSLANPCGVGVQNCATPSIQSLIPVIQTREFESVLRVQSGQVAVLGGLMQDSNSKIEDTIPGVNQLPLLGQLLEQRKDLNQKTELVIFLRPVVIREPSIDSDYARYRDLLPGPDYFTKPNPANPAPDLGARQ